jgi:hypothetical protein
MLIEHGVNDVDERFIAVDESVPPGENVTLYAFFAGSAAKKWLLSEQ